MANKKLLLLREKEAEIAALKEEIQRYKYESDMNYRMLESVNNTTHLAIWMAFFDEEGNQTSVRFTEDMRRMLGYSKDELPDTVEALAKIMHPDDTEAVFASYGEAVAKKDAKYEVEYRLLSKRGDYKMYRGAGECIRRPNGTPEVFIGHLPI